MANDPVIQQYIKDLEELQAVIAKTSGVNKTFSPGSSDSGSSTGISSPQYIDYNQTATVQHALLTYSLASRPMLVGGQLSQQTLPPPIATPLLPSGQPGLNQGIFQGIQGANQRAAAGIQGVGVQQQLFDAMRANPPGQQLPQLPGMSSFSLRMQQRQGGLTDTSFSEEIANKLGWSPPSEPQIGAAGAAGSFTGVGGNGFLNNGVPASGFMFANKAGGMLNLPAGAPPGVVQQAMAAAGVIPGAGVPGGPGAGGPAVPGVVPVVPAKPAPPVKNTGGGFSGVAKVAGLLILAGNEVLDIVEENRRNAEAQQSINFSRKDNSRFQAEMDLKNTKASQDIQKIKLAAATAATVFGTPVAGAVVYGAISLAEKIAEMANASYKREIDRSATLDSLIRQYGIGRREMAGVPVFRRTEEFLKQFPDTDPALMKKSLEDSVKADEEANAKIALGNIEGLNGGRVQLARAYGQSAFSQKTFGDIDALWNNPGQKLGMLEQARVASKHFTRSMTPRHSREGD